MNVLAPAGTPNANALTLADFVDLMQQGGIPTNDEIYEYFNPVDRKVLATWLARLARVRAFKITSKGAAAKVDQGRRARLVGKIFERMIVSLFRESKVLRVTSNEQSTVGEIDFVWAVLPHASTIPMLQSVGAVVLGEGKCQDCAPKAEWVIELTGNLSFHGSQMGFLFVASSSKKIESRARQAIGMSVALKTPVLPLGLAQLQRISSGEPVLAVLSEQHARTLVHSSALYV